MFFDNYICGFLICLFAGLATSLGAGVVYFINFKNRDLSNILSISLGISAGVMIAISIFELIPYALEKTDLFLTTVSFFFGFVGIMIIDLLVPHSYKEEHTDGIISINEESKSKKHEAKRAGYMTAFGLAIHNLPEGMTSFSGFIISPIIGLTTALAIAIHNIPEGLSVSVPLVIADDNRHHAFLMGSISGLMEPLGAIVIFLFFPFIQDVGLSLTLILPFVAGIMMFISIDELLPLAFKYEKHNLTTVSIVIGMVIMVLTLFILE